MRTASAYRDYLRGSSRRIDRVHFQMEVAVRAAERAAKRGKKGQLRYDAREFVPGIAFIRTREVAAYVALEREYIHRFDHIITVSDSLADLLVRTHHLADRPDVVRNAPRRLAPISMSPRCAR